MARVDERAQLVSNALSLVMAVIVLGVVGGTIASLNYLGNSELSEANFVLFTAVLAFLWNVYSLATMLLYPELTVSRTLMLLRLGVGALVCLFWFVSVCVLADLADIFADEIHLIENSGLVEESTRLSDFRRARSGAIAGAVIGSFLLVIWVKFVNWAFNAWYRVELHRTNRYDHEESMMPSQVQEPDMAFGAVPDGSVPTHKASVVSQEYRESVGG